MTASGTTCGAMTSAARAVADAGGFGEARVGRELSEDEKMQRERQRVGDSRGSSPTNGRMQPLVLVPLDGDLFLAKLDGTVTRLTETAEDELNPKLSTKGGYVSFVRDRRLWVGPVARRRDRSRPRRRPRPSTGARPNSSRRRKWRA